jgi:hypothetical protein
MTDAVSSDALPSSFERSSSNDNVLPWCLEPNSRCCLVSSLRRGTIFPGSRDYLIPANRVHQQSHHCVSSIVASIVATSDNVMASVPRMHAKPIDQPAESTLPDVRPLFSGSDREHEGIKDRSWFREKYIRAEQVQC